MTTTPDLALASEFPAADRAQWLALVDKVLKGAPFEKRLVSTTYDGIAIQPLYTAADESERPEQYPGQPNFTRGATAARPEGGAWEIRQTQVHPDPAEANRRIIEDLEGGAGSLALRLDIGGAGAVDGVVIGGAGDLATLLDGVYLDLVSIVLEAGTRFASAAELLFDLWDSKDVATDQRRGSLGADPLGALAVTGRLPQGLAGAMAEVADLAGRTAAWPNLRVVEVDTAPYVDAGASEAEELGLMLATGVAYLRELVDAGLSPADAARAIGFTVSADADVFASIAKLRAARRIWAHALAAAGVGDAAATAFSVRTAGRMMTRRDPWVNMLRTTAACFAAGVGGAEAVTVQPFDVAIGQADGLARRIARNTQLILQEESHVGAVSDPAGGSWFIESLTAQLADRAWARFVEIEAGGGLVDALLDGAVAASLAAIREARSANIAKRKDPLTGVSEFPDLGEQPVVREQPDVAARRAAAAAAWVGAPSGATSEAATATVMEPLGVHRLADGYEELRDRSDAHLAATGARPRAFLANLGPIATHTARATFAKNFLEAGGIEAVTNDGFADDAALAAAFAASGCRIAVICSSDAVYADRGAAAAAALVGAGAAHVVLAGNPGELREQLAGAGVSEFVHIGVDVLASLRQLQGIEGVA